MVTGIKDITSDPVGHVCKDAYAERTIEILLIRLNFKNQPKYLTNGKYVLVHPYNMNKEPFSCKLYISAHASLSQKGGRPTGVTRRDRPNSDATAL